MNIRILLIFLAGAMCFLLPQVAFTAQKVPAPEGLAVPYLKQDIRIRNLVILQYHHVAHNTPSSTSVTPEVFERHMALLAEQYNVIDLSTALAKIKNNQALPDKSVAITFDDGYTNILENAHPILVKYKFPYTIFINPAIIGESRLQLTWEQINTMVPLATFANHTLDHAHLLNRYGNENEAQWLKRVMNDIEQAESLITEKLGYSKKWLAYPFGEFNLALKHALTKAGYVSFGQQSGAVSNTSDFAALPRFPASGIYAAIPSLTVKLDSLAMPVDKVIPLQYEYKPDQHLQDLTLHISDKDVNISRLACYYKGNKQDVNNDHAIAQVLLNITFEPGRQRVNCTAPSNIAPHRYYWFSQPFFVATHEGEFLD